MLRGASNTAGAFLCLSTGYQFLTKTQYRETLSFREISPGRLRMEEVRRLRQEKGWNQNELAFHADLAPSVISLLETGKREPNATTLRKLAKALGVEIPDLFERADSPKTAAPRSSGPPNGKGPIFSEFIISAADKWMNIISDTGMKDQKRFGIAVAASAVGDAMEEQVDDAFWDSLPNEERLEIIRVMEKMTEVMEHVTQSIEHEILEDESRQNREKIREWTRRLSA
jgi:transcriptional regulator with XRE-family HTH domain